MRFSGKVDLPGDIGKQLYDLDIAYMAYWAHQFFGIEDGFVTTIRLARVTPDQDGMFELQLPDFSKDAMTKSSQLDAGIEFIAREQRTGNILTFLEPANVKPKVWSLPVKQSYPIRVVLRPRGTR